VFKCFGMYFRCALLRYFLYVILSLFIDFIVAPDFFIHMVQILEFHNHKDCNFYVFLSFLMELFLLYMD
jgi:hypothetical protein